MLMAKNQEGKISKKELKSTKLGLCILEKYTPKKDLIRKVTEFGRGYFSPRVLERINKCGDFVQHLTTCDLDKKRVHKSLSCGNRFCPICTWVKAKKDAVMIATVIKAMKTEHENLEYIFLTLTAPNVSGEELKNEIDRFNKAFKKLFERRNVKKIVKGYARKLEITYNLERFITATMYKGSRKDYFDRRQLKVGDNNPNYDTYHSHLHIIIAVSKSYFTSRDYISQAEWLEMWRECMDDSSITQVDIKKVRSSEKSEDGAVLELAKYAAKGNEIYHSASVFWFFYGALKGRQLLTYNGLFKEYVRKYKQGELDKYKKKDETEYTHLLTSIWQKSKYENVLRKLTVEEMLTYNQLAKNIENECDKIE